MKVTAVMNCKSVSFKAPPNPAKVEFLNRPRSFRQDLPHLSLFKCRYSGEVAEFHLKKFTDLRLMLVFSGSVRIIIYLQRD